MKGIGKDNSNSDVIKRNCLLKLVAKSFNEAHAVRLDLDQAGGYRQAKCTYNRMLGSIDMMEAQLSQAAQLGLIETTTRFQDKVRWEDSSSGGSNNGLHWKANTSSQSRSLCQVTRENQMVCP